MATPSTTVWDLEPHTLAKHAILQRYLQAWAPILGSRFPTLNYIDGFAGPGRYSEGEDGSPIIALNAALGHSTSSRRNFNFLFVELDAERATCLSSIVDEMDLPLNFNVSIEEAEFEQAIPPFLDKYLGTGPYSSIPTFAFIDPFGWTGFPFQIIRRILQSNSCEVLVTFMYEEINRFLGHPDQIQNFQRLFGVAEPVQIPTGLSPAQRRRYLHDLYVDQLRKEANVRFVRSFEMRNKKNATDYILFHATNNLLGLKRMKEAMWKVDETGGFSFSDATDPDQYVLLGAEPQFDILRSAILSRFGGTTTTIGEIEYYVVVETAFRETHYKTQILKPLEMANPPRLVAINPRPKRPRGTYADPKLQVRFV